MTCFSFLKVCFQTSDKVGSGATTPSYSQHDYIQDVPKCDFKHSGSPVKLIPLTRHQPVIYSQLTIDFWGTN